MSPAELDAYYDRLAAAAPPLNDEQKTVIRQAFSTYAAKEAA